MCIYRVCFDIFIHFLLFLFCFCFVFVFPVMLNGVWVFLCRRDVRKGGLMRWLRESRSLTSRPCHVMDPWRSRPPNALLRGRKRQPGFARSKKKRVEAPCNSYTSFKSERPNTEWRGQIIGVFCASVAMESGDLCMSRASARLDVRNNAEIDAICWFMSVWRDPAPGGVRRLSPKATLAACAITSEGII